MPVEPSSADLGMRPAPGVINTSDDRHRSPSPVECWRRAEFKAAACHCRSSPAVHSHVSLRLLTERTSFAAGLYLGRTVATRDHPKEALMHVRVITVRGAARLDDAVDFIRETILPD